MNESTVHRNPLRTMPNLLTFARICLAPFLVAAILEGRFEVGFWLFVIAGISDGLDGLLARVLQQRTVLGQYLDPVADKILLSTLFLVLTHEGHIPMWVTALVFGRDLGILVVAALLYTAVGRRDFKPSPLGKANTLAQIAAVAAVILKQFEHQDWVTSLAQGSLYATVAFTTGSGLHYAWLISRRSPPHGANGAPPGPAPR